MTRRPTKSLHRAPPRNVPGRQPRLGVRYVQRLADQAWRAAPVSSNNVRRLEKVEENRLIACTSHEGVSIRPGSCGRRRRVSKEAPHPPASRRGGGKFKGSFYQAWRRQGELASGRACALRPVLRAAESASLAEPSVFGICRSGGGKSRGCTPISPSQRVSGNCGLSRYAPGAMARGPGAERSCLREAAVPRQRWFAHRRRCLRGTPRHACALRPLVIERVARRSDLPGEPLAGAGGWRRRTAQNR